jgi:hypothetical protein
MVQDIPLKVHLHAFLDLKIIHLQLPVTSNPSHAHYTFMESVPNVSYIVCSSHPRMINHNSARFEVATVVLQGIQVVWDVKLCVLVSDS